MHPTELDEFLSSVGQSQQESVGHHDAEGEKGWRIKNDHRPVRVAFARMLQFETYAVYKAPPPDGLRFAVNEHPHAIKRGPKIPILSGLQFPQHLRKAPTTSKILSSP
ncbi:MAG: hypothetical protein CL483_13080 [Acidobacteria bacterium]|nr:hypothetical protein [Acidobacteriota bacterium]|tara:strand:- start:869 stop:1192 length:324 start_codon:yes stop_codon:yes gene_type:complete